MEEVVLTLAGAMCGFLLGRFWKRRKQEGKGEAFWRTAYFNLQDYSRELERIEKEIKEENK